MIYATKISRMERKSDIKRSTDEFYSNSGEIDGFTYEYQYIDGIKTLVPSGKVNRQDVIDSYADSQDINVIINKFLSGDTSVMNPSTGQYGDFTNYPTSYAELFSRVQDCKNVFDSMPVDIKEKFDNSYEVFWTQFGSDRFDEIFKSYSKYPDQVSDNLLDVEKINVVTPTESEVK